MRHAYMYNGAFESNYPELEPGTTTYKTTEGENRQLSSRADEIDGVRIGFMEKSGKKFYAVRVQYGTDDIVLKNPVAIDPMRHTNNRRLSPEALTITDDEASAMLDDIIRDNPDKQPELAMMINRINQVRRAARAKGES